MPHKASRRFSWAKLPDDQLLQLRLKDLKVTIEGTWLEGCLENLHKELDKQGLRVKPHAWLSSEWFSPDDTPGIAIPFFLAHPRLMRLERSQMFECEGAGEAECRRIFRHEAGHALEEAYRLNTRPRYIELFGNPEDSYPDNYKPRVDSDNTSSISLAGTLRAIRSRTSPKPLPSGSTPTQTGERPTKAGRRSKSSATSTS